jgi:hypothetical protein
LLLVLVVGIGAARSGEAADNSGPKFEVSFPASVHPQPITGRILLMIGRDAGKEPRLELGWPGDAPPVFGIDVDQLKPGALAVIDAHSSGCPFASLNDLPAGDYFVQALLNVYTEFHRSDGHTIWAHMDQWEGQQANRSPGNLYSQPQKLHVDPHAGIDFKLELTQVIPPVQIPPDTEWVKRIKIQSRLLTQFWGHPIYLGATILLPKGYSDHPDVHYPVVYIQNHFNMTPPFGFRSGSPGSDHPGSSDDRGYGFFAAWNSPDFPRFIAVTFQHPTPFYDDSYAVNSANNGPYGDALLTELIPYVEEHFRIIRKPYARILTGGSTGGWESLALQVYHPDFFGGTWTFYPDPVDFRRYGLNNIYEDENAFIEPGHIWIHPKRYIQRKPYGQPVMTTEDFSHFEAVLGSHDRSGDQLAAWEAAYGPVGDDGYPKPVWDKSTGAIDHSVALYMRDHGYDLRYYLETNWPRIGPQLVGKLHLYCGDMDSFYLNLAVYLLEDFLKGTTDPFYAGSFEYGRPMKGHGWMPMKTQDLVRMMGDYISRNAPPGEDTQGWHYH